MLIVADVAEACTSVIYGVLTIGWGSMGCEKVNQSLTLVLLMWIAMEIRGLVQS